MLANTIIIPIINRMVPAVIIATLVAIKPNAGASATQNPMMAITKPT